MGKRSVFLLLVIFTQATALFAKEPPEPTDRLVNDYANILSTAEREQLESKLDAFDRNTSNQLAIVIENSLEGDDAQDYSLRLANKWQIGHKKQQNGLLIYIAMQEHYIFIQVGRGLEGVITDGATGRIRREILNPHFKAHAYYAGLDSATNVLMALAQKEYSSDEYANNNNGKPGHFSLGSIILIIIVVIVIISIFRGGRGRGGGGWMLWPFLGGGFGGSGGGGFGGGSSGGGGFGGFGGGSFGGGGSGGSW